MVSGFLFQLAACVRAHNDGGDAAICHIFETKLARNETYTQNFDRDEMDAMTCLRRAVFLLDEEDASLDEPVFELTTKRSGACYPYTWFDHGVVFDTGPDDMFVNAANAIRFVANRAGTLVQVIIIDRHKSRAAGGLLSTLDMAAESDKDYTRIVTRPHISTNLEEFTEAWTIPVPTTRECGDVVSWFSTTPTHYRPVMDKIRWSKKAVEGLLPLSVCLDVCQGDILTITTGLMQCIDANVLGEDVCRRIEEDLYEVTVGPLHVYEDIYVTCRDSRKPQTMKADCYLSSVTHQDDQNPRLAPLTLRL